MDFKAQMHHGKAVETLPDGSQQAPFSFDFALGGKALEHTVDENGDLWIEGYASDFGVDRQDEAFEPGAFERGLKTFLQINPIMLYHHQYDKALGQFTDARVDQKGLWVRGRVDAPAKGSWAEDVVNKIRKGTIRSFSVGGLFRRRMTQDGPRIYDVDLGEISITPLAINPRTTFAVVARKAFENAEVKAPEAVAPAPVVTPPVVDEEQTVIVPEAAPAADEKPEKPAEEDESTVEQPLPEAEPENQPGTVTSNQIAAGAITSEKIASGSVTTEHLADDLRTRFSELLPEAPSVENAHERLAAVAAQLGQVFEKLGMEPSAPIEEAPTE